MTHCLCKASSGEKWIKCTMSAIPLELNPGSPHWRYLSKLKMNNEGSHLEIFGERY